MRMKNAGRSKGRGWLWCRESRRGMDNPALLRTVLAGQAAWWKVNAKRLPWTCAEVEPTGMERVKTAVVSGCLVPWLGLANYAPVGLRR
jgi:hypothetical protein